MQLTSTAALSTPERLRKLAEWMDSYGMAQDLLNNIYLDMDVIQETAAHIYDVLTDFVAHMTREDAWRGGQDQGYPWGSVRVIDEIVNDLHLKDRGFFVDVEHPELERTFTYPGPPAIYGDSPWGISRRAPLIGEHNREVLADELGMSADDLAALTEAGDA